MLCAAPSAARALQTFEPPRTEPEHTVRRAFPEHGVLRIEDLPHVPFKPSSHHALSSASRTSLTCPIPFRTLQRKSSSAPDIPLYDGKPYLPLPSGKKKGGSRPPE